MRGDRIHVVQYVLGTSVVVPPTGDITATHLAIDLPRTLSDRFGRNLPACAVYDVTRVRVKVQPAAGAGSDEDVGAVLSGELSWVEPTAARVRALRWAAREFKMQKRANYETPSGMQFYPKAFPFSFVVEDHFSKRDDDGKFFTATGGADATHYPIFFTYNVQKPEMPQAPARAGAQPQVTKLWTGRAEDSMESIVHWSAGYGIGVMERWANNAVGPEDAPTNWGGGTLYVHHARTSHHVTEFDLEAGATRSYPWLLGQALLTVDQAFPKRKTGMWGGNETLAVTVEVECVGWNELR